MALGSDFILTITSALLGTFDLQRILYVILSGATAGDGLGFNRALLFLADRGGHTLRGQLAIGAVDEHQARAIWSALAQQRLPLAALIDAAHERRCLASPLNALVRGLALSLPVSATHERWARLLQRVLDGQVAVVENEAALPLGGADVTLRRYAAVPLVLEGQPIGVLLAANCFSGQPVLPERLADLATLANLATMAVARARMHEDLRRRAEEDGLTGLINRRHFATLLTQAFADSLQYGEPLALAMIDVDHFKAINDTHGHLAGDAALQHLARVLQRRLRRSDVAARVGGDELALVLPRASAQQAARIAEDLRHRLAADPPVDGPPLTLSVGVAQRQAGQRDPGALLLAADQALYRAKREGRDRVVIAPPGLDAGLTSGVAPVHLLSEALGASPVSATPASNH